MSLEPYTVAAEIVVEVETEAGHVGIGEIHGRPQVGDHRDPPALPVTARRRGCARPRAALRRHVPLDLHPRRLPASRPPTGSHTSAPVPSLSSWRPSRESTSRSGTSRARRRACRSGSCSAGAARRCRRTRAGGTTGPTVRPIVDELVGRDGRIRGARASTAVKLKVGGLSIAEDVARVACGARGAAGRGDHARRQLGLRRADGDRGGCVPSSPSGSAGSRSPSPGSTRSSGSRGSGAQTSIPLASGERELHRFGCRDLVDHTPIRYLQFDCTRAGGITEWLRVGGLRICITAC